MKRISLGSKNLNIFPFLGKVMSSLHIKKYHKYLYNGQKLAFENPVHSWLQMFSSSGISEES